jgi:glycosyltransferase involved in cell wall biosynthesis
MQNTEQSKFKAKKKILYISYDGILEPLGHSQVLKYLELLSKNFEITLISFEKINNKVPKRDLLAMQGHCLKKNIRWKPKKYHQGIFLLSHMMNIFNIIFYPFIEMLKKGHQIIHIRSYMPGLGMPLLKTFFNFKLVFDIRGFWADEKVDRLGWSKNSFKYKFFKVLENQLFRNADAVVTLTNSSKIFIQNTFNKASKDIGVIRTCVDFSEFNMDKDGLRPFDINKSLIVGYLGSIDTAYDFNAFLNLIKNLDQKGLKIKLRVLSNTTHKILESYLNKNNLSHLQFEVLFLKRHELSKEINKFDLLGFALKPSFSLIASMPTKIAESLACGVPIICNNFNDDINEMIELYKVGILYDFSKDLDQETYKKIIETITDEASPKRCSEFSKENFSLELGVSQYHQIYKNL